MADQSCLLKIVLIMQNRCSKAYPAKRYFNRTRTNLAHSNKQMAERKYPICSLGFHQTSRNISELLSV